MFERNDRPDPNTEAQDKIHDEWLVKRAQNINLNVQGLGSDNFGKPITVSMVLKGKSYMRTFGSRQEMLAFDALNNVHANLVGMKLVDCYEDTFRPMIHDILSAIDSVEDALIKVMKG